MHFQFLLLMTVCVMLDKYPVDGQGGQVVTFTGTSGVRSSSINGPANIGAVTSVPSTSVGDGYVCLNGQCYYNTYTPSVTNTYSSSSGYPYNYGYGYGSNNNYNSYGSNCNGNYGTNSNYGYNSGGTYCTNGYCYSTGSNNYNNCNNNGYNNYYGNSGYYGTSTGTTSTSSTSNCLFNGVICYAKKR